jgi:hypothetical protein
MHSLRGSDDITITHADVNFEVDINNMGKTFNASLETHSIKSKALRNKLFRTKTLLALKLSRT